MKSMLEIDLYHRHLSPKDTSSFLGKYSSNNPVFNQVVQEENNVLQVDLSKPPDEDIVDDCPVSVRDALVFLELANFETEHSVPGVSGNKVLFQTKTSLTV